MYTPCMEAAAAMAEAVVKDRNIKKHTQARARAEVSAGTDSPVGALSSMELSKLEHPLRLCHPTTCRMLQQTPYIRRLITLGVVAWQHPLDMPLPVFNQWHF